MSAKVQAEATTGSGSLPVTKKKLKIGSNTVEIDPGVSNSPIVINAPGATGFLLESVLLAAATVWAIYEKLNKPKLWDRLVGPFSTLREERETNMLLAQIGILAGADRVLLVAFHNGQWEDGPSGGYCLSKMSTVNVYMKAGVEPMRTPIHHMPIGRVQIELDQLRAAGGWSSIEMAPDLPARCTAHLERNTIVKMTNRLVQIGKTEIGIVSLQFTSEETAAAGIFPSGPCDACTVIEDLFEQVSSKMRRRVVRPNLAERIRMLAARATRS